MILKIKHDEIETETEFPLEMREPTVASYIRDVILFQEWESCSGDVKYEDGDGFGEPRQWSAEDESGAVTVKIGNNVYRF